MWRMLVALVCIALVPVLLIQGAIYYRWFSERFASADRSNLEFAHATAMTFHEYVLEVWRQEAALGSALTALQPYKPGQANQFLTESASEYDAVRSFNWTDAKGRVIASSDPRAIGIDVGDRQYFADIVGGRDWSISDIVIGRASGEPTVVIARAVRARDSLAGVVFADVDPSRLGGLFAARNRPARSTVLLFDRKGMLVYGSPETKLTDHSWLDDDPLLAPALAGAETTGIFVSPIDGEKYVSARVPVSETGWAAGTGQLESELLAPIRSIVFFYTGLAAVVAVASILLSLGFSRSIVSSLRRLQDHAYAVGEGQLEHRAEVGGIGELRDLADSFNLMAAQLLDERHAQQRAAAGLAAANARLQGEIAERTRAQEKLAATSLRLRFHLENTPLGVVEWDSDYRITRWSDEAARIFGWAGDEVLGKRIDELRLIHEEDVPKVTALMADMNVGTRPRNVDANRNYRKDGTVIYCEWYNSALRDDSGKLVSVFSLVLDATERVRARQEVDALARFPAENPNPVLRIAADGTLLYANPASAFLLAEWNCSVGAAVPSEWTRLVRETMDSGRRKGLEVDLEERTLSFVIAPVPAAGYANVYALDITDRKRAEEAVEEARRNLELRVKERTAEIEEANAALRSASVYARSLIEASLDPVVTISHDGKITDVNEATELALGVPRERLLRSDFSDYFTEPEKARQGYREVIAGGFVRDYPLTIRHASGRTMDVLYNATVYRDEAGKIQGVFAAARDITERKRAEAELLRHREHLEDLVRERTAQREHRTIELEAANKELEAFAYSVSHDLRGPLRSIDGFSHALVEDYGSKLDDKAKDYLARVRAASQRMGFLIDDLLKLSRVTRVDMKRETVDLSAMARAIASELHQAQPDRSVDVRIAEGVTASGDPQLLRTALANLLENAWKFTGKHPRAAIEFGSVNKDGRTVYFVRDDGAGFDMAYAAKLFGPFQRLHSTDAFPGSGIGLATVQRVINRHGGKIWAEGTVEKGAAFYFTL
jgi:PAS domain S-box-containing protein